MFEARIPLALCNPHFPVFLRWQSPRCPVCHVRGSGLQDAREGHSGGDQRASSQLGIARLSSGPRRGLGLPGKSVLRTVWRALRLFTGRCCRITPRPEASVTTRKTQMLHRVSLVKLLVCPQAVIWLLKNGADKDAKDAQGRTAEDLIEEP